MWDNRGINQTRSALDFIDPNLATSTAEIYGTPITDRWANQTGLNLEEAGYTGDIKRQGLSVDKIGYDTAQKMNAREYKNWLNTTDEGQGFKSWNPKYAAQLLNALKDPTNIAKGK